MRIRTPKSRYDLQIRKHDTVLEVGGGHNPHKRSNVVVDKFVDTNYHRKTDLKVHKHQKFMQADGAALPFGDNEFDYVISNQVLEHVDDPASFLHEQMRVAKRGYIETPSLIGEYLFPKKAHKWLVLAIDEKLILFEKEKYWFETELDFGFVFLTWLQKTSFAYKLLVATRPNLQTVRYEWAKTIEFEVNPSSEDYKKYFSSYWDEAMTREFFPPQSRLKDMYEVWKNACKIIWRAMLR